MHADVTHLVLGFFFFFVSLDIRFTSSQINNELQCNFRTKKNMPNGMSANDFACCMNNNNGRRPYFHGSLLYITLLYSKHKKCMRTENSINIPKQLLIAWHSRLRFQFQFYGLVGKLETHEICTCLMLAHWYGKIFFFFIMIERTIDSLQWITTQRRPLKYLISITLIVSDRHKKKNF